LLEGITFILDTHGFELHKKVTSPRQNLVIIIEAVLLGIPNGYPQLIKLFLLPRHARDNATHFPTEMAISHMGVLFLK
jgi:hypothetical protein